MSNWDNEFEQFRGNLEDQEAQKAELEAILDRFKTFLEARGVDTDETRIDVVSLATSKLLLDEVVLLKPAEVNRLNFKKNLQAEYFLKDYDPAWQELIDKEFQGEPLTDDDIDIMAEVFNRNISVSEDIKRQYQNTEADMLDYLAKQGIDTTPESLSEEDRDTLDYLIFTYNFDIWSPPDKFEKVYSVLINRGYAEDPTWLSLLNKFFPHQEWSE